MIFLSFHPESNQHLAFPQRCLHLLPLLRYGKHDGEHQGLKYDTKTSRIRERQDGSGR